MIYDYDYATQIILEELVISKLFTWVFIIFPH